MKKDCKTVWKGCLEIIKDNLGKENESAFKTWFEPIVPVMLEDNTLTIQVPSQFFYEWLEEHFIELIKRSIRRQLGPTGMLKYSIVVDGSVTRDLITTDLPSTAKKVSNDKPISLPININKEGASGIPNPFILPGIQKVKVPSHLNENYTLENFVEGDCNRLARTAGFTVAQEPGGTAFNPILLYGGVGLGKTHLAHAIGIKTKELHTDKTVLYVTSEEFMQQYAEAGKNKTIPDFMHFYEQIDVLIVDDIQFWAGKAPGTQDAFFHIFNHLHQQRKQIIITSDKSPAEITGIETRLLSRFKWGLQADLTMPDVTTRRNILYKKLENDGIKMPSDVIDYLAYSVNTNVRELEGVLISLMAQSSLNNKDITLELARQMIDKFVRSTNREPSIDYIQKVVCDYFKITPDAIQSHTRKREIVQARQLVMYFAKKMTKNSLAVIGSQCGNKDHATVLHACKAIEGLKSSDKQVEYWVKEIEKRFTDQ